MDENLGYPEYFFFIIAILGLIFLIWRPKYNFWFSLFYFSARELRTAAFTRLEGFGPYINLDDFVIIILLITIIRIYFLKGASIPSPFVLLIISFVFSVLLVNLNYSFIYEVQREHKAALYFILAIFFGYNLVQFEKELETFLKMLFLGSIVASIQYLITAQSQIETFGTTNIQETIRSVGFMGLIPVFLITSFFIKLKWIANFQSRIIYIIGLGLLLINIILSQTRSLYLSIILTLIIILIFFSNRQTRTKSSLIILILLPFIVTIIFDWYLNYVKISDLLFERFALLQGDPSSDISAFGRILATRYEFYSFLNSNIFFGNGLGFTYFLPEAYNPYIAWGHVGHIAYLSRLGLLGFFTYSIFIPFVGLNFLIKEKLSNIKLVYSKVFLLFGIALLISDWIGFWMSSSYLGLNAFLPGVVIGTIWAIKDKKITISKIANGN